MSSVKCRVSSVESEMSGASSSPSEREGIDPMKL